MVTAALLAAASMCPAEPVITGHNPALSQTGVSTWVAPRPGPIYGVTPGGHSGDGLFSTYVHGVDPHTGIRDKVLWVVPPRRSARAGRRLRLEWRLGRRIFVQHRQRAYSTQTAGALFPSILRAPTTGCWSLSLRTGRIRAKMTVLVLPQPAP